jgi:hypothetical protein
MERITLAKSAVAGVNLAARLSCRAMVESIISCVSAKTVSGVRSLKDGGGGTVGRELMVIFRIQRIYARTFPNSIPPLLPRVFIITS